MHYTAPLLALAIPALAQDYPSYGQIPSETSNQYISLGGALPAGIRGPSTAGFKNATTLPSRGGSAVCTSGWVNVTASTSKNVQLNYTLPLNQSQVTETFLEYVTAGSSFKKQVMGGMQTVSGTYEIYAELCTPANNTSPQRVQFATHGIGFDRTYWDWAPGYSYVDEAARNNYATFIYDRLGVGMSAKPDALSVVQSPLEVEIANSLIQQLRRGAFSNTNFSRVVGVGHSFGSIITEAITAQYPTTLDSAILTGFSVNSSSMPIFLQGLNLAIASQNAPYRFSDLSNGYLVSSSAISNQIGFFRAPNFDPTQLNLAEATKGTVTIGELFTTTTVVTPATNYTGPVAIVNGLNDLPFCGGNCTYPTNLAQEAFKMLYTQTNRTGYYFAPTTGHGVNLHYSAVAAFHWIQSFINANN